MRPDRGSSHNRASRPAGQPAGSDVFVEPAQRLRGELTPPADKSISHRAALLGAMCDEPVRIHNYLDAADTRSTLAAVAALGALVEHRDGGEVVVRGAGLRGAQPPQGPIDVGNAGTLMRLLPGWLAGQQGRTFALDGDASIRRRPVDRIAEPLRAMGARLDATDGRFPPFRVEGTQLRSIAYDLPVASAQVKSCVLLAGLLAAGVGVRRTGTTVALGRVDELGLEDLTVPADPSSAAFAVAAGVLVPGSRLIVRDCGANWTRTGFLRIVQRMGGIVLGDLEEPPTEGIPAGEPVTDLDVAAGPLVGTVVEPEEVPLAIDELPLVALLGCFAEGETVVRGAQELRVKESDRIATVVDGLRGLGADIEATADGFAVRGTGGLRGGVIASHGDHRIAMLGAVAGLASREGVRVEGMEVAAVSYPRFMDDMAGLR
jgi:3-phosphoshikimate 1-carboxyvinyltransferase